MKTAEEYFSLKGLKDIKLATSTFNTCAGVRPVHPAQAAKVRVVAEPDPTRVAPLAGIS